VKEMFDPAFVSDEPEPLVDQQSRDCTALHTRLLRWTKPPSTSQGSRVAGAGQLRPKGGPHWWERGADAFRLLPTRARLEPRADGIRTAASSATSGAASAWRSDRIQFRRRASPLPERCRHRSYNNSCATPVA
jgi:hypothetical protein